MSQTWWRLSAFLGPVWIDLYHIKVTLESSWCWRVRWTDSCREGRLCTSNHRTMRTDGALVWKINHHLMKNHPSWEQWRIYIVKFWNPPSNFLHFHPVFGKFWPNNRLVSFLSAWRPPLENPRSAAAEHTVKEDLWHITYSFLIPT